MNILTAGIILCTKTLKELLNRAVVGSSPTRGVDVCNSISAVNICIDHEAVSFFIRLHGQAVKTPPFHGGNRGSNPLGVT